VAGRVGLVGVGVWCGGWFCCAVGFAQCALLLLASVGCGRVGGGGCGLVGLCGLVSRGGGGVVWRWGLWWFVLGWAGGF